MKFRMKMDLAQNRFFWSKMVKNDFFLKPCECRTKNLIFFEKIIFLPKKDNQLPTVVKICLFWAKLALFFQSEVKNFIFEIYGQEEVFYSDFIYLSEKIDIFCSKVKKVALIAFFWLKKSIFLLFWPYFGHFEIFSQKPSKLFKISQNLIFFVSNVLNTF